MASTRLTKVFGTSGNRNKWTWSSWIKRSKFGNTNRLFGVYQNAQYSTTCYLSGGNSQLVFIDTYNSAEQGKAVTSASYKDVNGWYHIVVTYDKNNATSADKLIFYVNGERVSLSDYIAPTQATTWNVDGLTMEIGAFNSADYFDGSMSHIHFCDGQAYQASDFGEYDANGVWKIKTSPSVTYGTNGFFILKDGNNVTDQSGNGNNWTVAGGTLTNTEDNPSNVFATLNFLNYTSSAVTYSNGNTKGTYPGTWIASQGTIGGMTGKYFWEAKVNSGNNANLFYGICRPNIDLDTSPQNQTGVICQHINGDRYVDGTYTASTAEALVNGDILGVALDLDSATKTVKFYKNGTLLSSGSSINLTSTYDNEFILPFFAGNNSSASSIWETNFGNGYFSTTAVASAGTNASGNGIFEHDVPANHTALSTKGLNL